jgi:hypothetical protein
MDLKLTVLSVIFPVGDYNLEALLFVCAKRSIAGANSAAVMFVFVRHAIVPVCCKTRCLCGQGRRTKALVGACWTEKFGEKRHWLHGSNRSLSFSPTYASRSASDVMRSALICECAHTQSAVYCLAVQGNWLGKHLHCEMKLSCSQ